MKVAIPIFSLDTKLFLNQAYLDYVKDAGYVPVLINEYSLELIDRCDGLLLPGGGDIDPIYYGNDNISSNNVCPEKDEFERGLLHTFISQQKPILGICRGFQLLARELFMDSVNDFVYYQHVGGHSQEQSTSTRRGLASHYVLANEGVLYGNRIIEHIAVNSMHHQAVTITKASNVKSVDSIVNISAEISGDILNTQLLIGAITTYNVPRDEKYILEAFSIPDIKVTAVQWHPEELHDTKLLQHAMESVYGS